MRYSLTLLLMLAALTIQWQLVTAACDPPKHIVNGGCRNPTFGEDTTQPITIVPQLATYNDGQIIWTVKGGITGLSNLADSAVINLETIHSQTLHVAFEGTYDPNYFLGVYEYNNGIWIFRDEFALGFTTKEITKTVSGRWKILITWWSTAVPSPALQLENLKLTTTCAAGNVYDFENWGLQVGYLAVTCSASCPDARPLRLLSNCYPSLSSASGWDLSRVTAGVPAANQATLDSWWNEPVECNVNTGFLFQANEYNANKMTVTVDHLQGPPEMDAYWKIFVYENVAAGRSTYGYYHGQFNPPLINQEFTRKSTGQWGILITSYFYGSDGQAVRLLPTNAIKAILECGETEFDPLKPKRCMEICTQKGTRDMGAGCVAPDIIGEYDTTVYRAESSEVRYQGHDAYQSLAPGKAKWFKLRGPEARAPILKLLTEPDAADLPNVVLHIYEDVDGSEEDYFHGEFNFVSDWREITSKGNGVWKVLVVNWDRQTTATISPHNYRINYWCEGNEVFNPYVTPKVCVVPDPELCKYYYLGVNPWERWQIIANRFSAKQTTIVQGRVWAISDCVVEAAARVHELKESYLPKGIPRFSITAAFVNIFGTVEGSVEGNDAVTLQPGSVVKGNVFSINSGVTMTDARVDGKAAAYQGVSVVSGDSPVKGAFTDTALDMSTPFGHHVFEYFSKLSAELAAKENSHVGLEKDVAKREVRIRVHGKINIVNDITAADFANIDSIVLVGHPLGLAIINVNGAPAFGSKLRVVYEDSKGVRALPTFGRVLLNIYTPVTIVVNGLDGGKGGSQITAHHRAAGVSNDTTTNATQHEDKIRQMEQMTEADPVHISMLIPRGEVTVSNLALKGFVHTDILKATDSKFYIQPFGTTANRLKTNAPRAPKVWTSAGYSKTKCVWHTI